MAKTVMDGTEQELFVSTELGEYSGYIFLDAMASGDSIQIKCYVKDVEDEDYILADTATFDNAQTVACIRIAQVIGKIGLKITGKQTAGTYKTLTHMWFKRG